MKQKLDFITNSSSTNFVIADYRKDTNELNTELVITVNVEKYVSTILSTEEEFFDYYINEENYVKEDALRYFGEYLDEIKNGAVIKILVVHTDGDLIESMLCQEGIGKMKMTNGVKVIRGEGGY